MKPPKLGNSLTPIPVPVDGKAKRRQHEHHAMEAAVRHLNTVMFAIGALVFGIWYSLL